MVATPARIRSTRACCCTLTSSRSATTACRAAAAASAAGTFSNPGARSSIRSSTGNGCRHRAPLRTSSTPTPAGPPHLCAEAAAALHPSGSASRPADAHASVNTGTPSATAASSLTGWVVPTSWLADCTASTLVPGGGGATATRPRRSTGSSSAAPPAQSTGVEDRGVLDRGVGDPAARAGALVQAEQPQMDRCGARGGERHLVGADLQRLGHDGAGVVEQQPRGPPARCRRRGSAYPWSSAARYASRAAGWSGSDEAASQ